MLMMKMMVTAMAVFVNSVLARSTIHECPSFVSCTTYRSEHITIILKSYYVDVTLLVIVELSYALVVVLVLVMVVIMMVVDQQNDDHA